MPKANAAHNELSLFFLEKITRLAAQEAQENAARDQQHNYFRGSWTSACMREIYYRRKGMVPSNPFPPDVWAKVTKGTVLHQQIQELLSPDKRTAEKGYFVDTFELTAPEQELAAEFSIPGVKTKVRLVCHIDGILFKKGQPWSIFELKTTSENGYRSVQQSAFTDPDHYSFKYFLQANRYLHVYNANIKAGLIQPSGPPLKGMTLMVYNCNGTADKETGLPWRDWSFAIDPVWFKWDMARLATVEEALQNDRLPERHYETLGWNCKSCAYRDQCWPHGGRSAPTRSPEATVVLPGAGQPFGSGPLPGGPEDPPGSAGEVAPPRQGGRQRPGTNPSGAQSRRTKAMDLVTASLPTVAPDPDPQGTGPARVSRAVRQTGRAPAAGPGDRGTDRSQRTARSKGGTA